MKGVKLRRLLPALACCLLLAGCARRPETPEERGLTLAEERAYTFSDGVSVDRWRDVWDGDRYCLADGTVLLWVQKPVGPEDSFDGQERIQDLDENARAAVLDWFEDRGLLYDTERELERAYGRYLASQKCREPFQEGLVEQIISPSGSNDAMICFTTEVTLPLEEPQMVEMLTPQTAFDRKTGEVISGWDLFTIPEAEVRAWVAEHAAGDDPVLRREMEAALEPEWIYLSPEGLSVDFLQGTLPSQETAYGWFEEYEKAPGAVLQPWAILDGPEE